MQEFNFIKAKNLTDACNLLTELGSKAKIIAGGTDLIIELRQEKLSEEVETIIDISCLDELKYIREEDGFVKIGAGTTHAEIVRSELIQENAPVLAEAAGSVGSPQIRNRGTVGGNIITASPCADTVPVLLALDAVAVLKKGDKTREVSLEELLAGPYKVNLADDELLTEIYFKKLPGGAKGYFYKLARRKAVAKSRMSITAIAVQDSDKKILDIRLTPGAVTPVPIRFKEVEEMLSGQKADAELIKKAGEMVADQMVNITGYRWSTDYKKPVINSLTVRALNSVLEVE